MKRRDFIQTSVAATAGLLTIPSLIAEAKEARAIGLQLYTLREVITKDVKGTLNAVAVWGYSEVETYGYAEGKLFGLSVAEFSTYMKGLGLNVVSGHYGVDLATGSKWEQACADAQLLGQKYVVVPYMSNKFYSSLDTLKMTCESLNKAGEVAKKYGLQMGYHNHAFEFQKVEGKVIIDTMLQDLDPKLVTWELDLFWVVNAGQDPLQYFEKFPGRFQLWHVKDMDKSDANKNADVGTGKIDFKNIFAKAEQSGMRNFFVEQETYPVNPMQSTENCIKYLKTIL